MALPPPPVTFPATRPASFDVSGISTFQDDHFPRASPVFIRATQTCLTACRSQAFRLRFRASNDSGFPLLLSANGVSPPPFHLPVPVKVPVSNLDCDYSLHPIFLMSSRKYFNYCPINTAFLWKSCGISVDKIFEILWKSLWKTAQLSCCQQMRSSRISTGESEHNLISVKNKIKKINLRPS